MQISLEALSDFGFDVFWHDLALKPRPSLEQMRSLQLRLTELFRLHGPLRMQQCVQARQLRAWLGNGFEWVLQPTAVEKFHQSSRTWPALDSATLATTNGMPASIRALISSLDDESCAAKPRNASRRGNARK